MGTITVGQENSAPIELYYEDHGSGDPVVLLHGWPLDSRSWEPQVHPLLEAGHRVIVYDRRGFGRSSRPTDGLRLRHARRPTSTRVLTELDLRDATLVGFSLGHRRAGPLHRPHGTDRLQGAACSSRASRRRSPSPPRTREGVDQAGRRRRAAGDPRRPLRVADRADRRLPQPRRVPRHAGERGDRARALERRRRGVADARPGRARPAGWRTSAEDIKRIDVPTLILHGTADRILPIDGQGRRLHAALPDARYVEIEGGPHVMCVTHAAEVNRELLAFLREPARVRRRRAEAQGTSAMAVQIPRSCSSRPPRASSTRPRHRRSSTSSSPPRARKVLDDLQAAPVDKLPVDEEWITVPAAVGDVRVRIVKPRRRAAVAARHRLHARRRLDPRQRRHPRPARARARRRRRARRCCSSSTPTRPRRATRSRSSRATRPRSGSSAKARRKGLDAAPHGRRRRVRRRQHGRRADADGQAARRRDVRADVDVLPGHRRGDGHRLLRRVRRGLLPHPQGDGVVLGRLHHRPRPSAREITASPNQATHRAAPTGCRRRSCCVDEADPLRDEGEAYAAKLRAAGVAVTTVRYDGVVHDFMLLNALSETKATRAAIAQATAFLRGALGTD